MIQGLRLLYIKNKYYLPDQAFNEILKIFKLLGISLYKLQRTFKKLIPLEPKLVDMCWNSCCLFSNENSNCEVCPNCGEPRYADGQTKKARKSAAYFSIIDSLRIQYKDPSRAKILHYRHE